MADFCRQCTQDVLGADPENNDMKGRVTEKKVKEGFCGIGICEGCGGGEFDHTGACMGGCLESSHKLAEYMD